MPLDRAASLLREGRGKQWDPTIVDAMLCSISGQLERPTVPHLRLVGAAADSEISGVTA
jgi:HD-GYP domain-containing protein (c-di-GMP phosphodiesterase class II)